MESRICTVLTAKNGLNRAKLSNIGEDLPYSLIGLKAKLKRLEREIDMKPDRRGMYKQLLLVKLEEFNIRLEDNGDEANWLHIDLNPPINNRFFKP